jgi:hypothetical protein
MRDFSLERRYDLVIIGATSITLLDREERSRLYVNVRRHLTAKGVFAFTIAGEAAAARLVAPIDQEIGIPGPRGEEPYLFSQQIEEGGAVRVINWVRLADIAEGREVTVVTSRLRVLSHVGLSRELVDSGFSEPAVSPVRADRGTDILLLTTSWQGREDRTAGDGSP